MIYLYDTTLRDGTQRQDISLSCEDKLALAKRLDEAGIHYIEGGWPGSNPKDEEFFSRARHLSLRQAKIAAFGATRRKFIRCEEDANLQALITAQTPVVTIVGKSWDFHVHQVLSVGLHENLAMISESVAYLKGLGREVVFDAEHFFDGFKANPEYAIATLQAAESGGADWLVLCETNGGCLPWEVQEIVTKVAAARTAPLGIHAHNDSGCAVANSLVAVRAGCRQVQGTLNGYGERVGNANLITILPNLQIKMGIPVASQEQIQKLTGLSRFASEVANLNHDPYAPYVGANAFAHKGGIHVAAMLKNSATYQHIDPAQVGNESRAVVSELSGRGNLLHLAKARGMEVDQEEAQSVLQRIKSLEHAGFTFEAAEASVQLMLRRTQKDYSSPFELIDFMVLTEYRQGRGLFSEATVKVRIGDVVKFTAAEGNGPISALVGALHEALRDHYPQLETVRLTDYKVRIVDSEKGAAATTRVLTDFHDGQRTWRTVGASANIIEASWQAVSDSLEYALLFPVKPDL
ncbi:(R)-citramalate synthase [Gammaproteobacteria bacterium]